MEKLTYDGALLNVRKLIAKHVNLFSKNTYEIDILPGWLDTVSKMLDELQEVVKTSGGTIEISKIAPKFGTIRIDYSTKDLPTHIGYFVETLVSMAESKTLMQCAYCGEYGVRKSLNGVATVKCSNHADHSDFFSSKSVYSFVKHEDELKKILRQEN